MKLKDHEKLDVLMFGKSFGDVHQWLDELYGEYVPGGKRENLGGAYYHWCEHHSHEAIREKYGVHTEEYDSAKLHIIIDWVAHWGKVKFPKDRGEVIKLLDEELGLK